MVSAMTRNDFKRILELRKEIVRALNLWENAIASATSTTAVLTGMPKGNNISSKVENAVIKAEVYKERYDALCDEQKEIYNRLRIDIKRLNETEQKVINMIYPKGMKMTEISKQLGMTERHVYRIKKTALNKICW